MANQKVQKLINTPLWKLAIRFMIPITIVLVIFFVISELIKSGNLNAVSESLNNGNWIPFVITRIAIVIGYGFVMAFVTKNKAKNSL